MGNWLKITVLVAICLIPLFIVPAFAVDITIIEVEPNPSGKDEGNEWVRLFNPFSNSVDLTGWEIISTHGQVARYTLSQTIPACSDLKIVFPYQVIDNELEVLFLDDNFGNTVDQTSMINDKDNDATTWQREDPPCVSTKRTESVYEEPIIVEPEYLENGCPVGYPYIWSDGLCYSIPEIQEQEPPLHGDPEPVGIGFYSNELYEFSFEISREWLYWENFLWPDGITTSQVVFAPREVTYETLQESGILIGLSALFSGLPFPIEAPIISVTFENIAESKIPRMNIQEIEKYEREFVITNLPNAKIIDLDVKSTSWGWVASGKIVFSIGQSQLISETNTYYFKDRESYSVSYSAHEDIYDQFKPVFDHVIDTLIIKSIAVPEFQEIAMVVLASSIVLVVVFARKFKVMKILNS